MRWPTARGESWAEREDYPLTYSRTWITVNRYNPALATNSDFREYKVCVGSRMALYLASAREVQELFWAMPLPLTVAWLLSRGFFWD